MNHLIQLVAQERLVKLLRSEDDRPALQALRLTSRFVPQTEEVQEARNSSCKQLWGCCQPAYKGH